MGKLDAIIELHPWLAGPAGQALRDWEQSRMDALVADVFGFHALQLGLPEVDALRTNRVQHRWLALDAAYQGWQWPPESDPKAPEDPSHLRCDFECLPFPAASLDLVVMPHALELARDPHHTLREVARVLVPEGRVVIAGFNPVSWWGVSQRLGQWGVRPSPVLPEGEFIGYWRLRDWLRLLDLEVQSSEFGCWRPMLKQAAWWDRLAWMEGLGERWWPVLGAVYCVVAVKRSRGMRLLGPRPRTKFQAQSVPAVARHGQFRVAPPWGPEQGQTDE